jgi:hypothetical protein
MTALVDDDDDDCMERKIANAILHLLKGRVLVRPEFYSDDADTFWKKYVVEVPLETRSNITDAPTDR